MPENKTKPGDANVEQYIAGIDDERRRGDCEALLVLLSKLTKEKPRMWGSSIVGFGRYHYKYKSGREGDMCRTGFSSRKRDLTVYLLASGVDQDELLAKLGKHRMGKACLYIRWLSDVDIKVLEKLIAGSLVELKRRYG